MKEPAAASDTILPSTASTSTKRHTSPATGRYKLFAAILLIAFWSMLADTVTLKPSSRRPSDDDLGGPDPNDIDVLEMQERQKVVRRMWDVYRNSGRLPKFWQQAFEAAYQELTADDSRNAAVAEIASLSMRMADLHPLPEPIKNPEQEIIQNEGDDMPKSKPSSSSVKAQ